MIVDTPVLIHRKPSAIKVVHVVDIINPEY